METHTPQKQLSMTAVLKTLKRRWMLVAIPVAVLTVAVAFYAKKMPNRYRSRVLVATVAVTPEPYLSGRPEATVAANVQEQLRTIRETLLGSAVLNRVIRENNLYPVTAEGASDQSLDAMRSMIQIQVEAPDAFYVGF